MLPEKLKRYIDEHGLVAPGDRVLLAVSGGVDSMVMLSLFAKGGYDFGVAHCNFQLRDKESDDDTHMVETEANRLGVPFHTIRFDTQAEMQHTGESVQMAARRLRYAWFDSLCREFGYTVIAIAHHADDSVETFFINLLRGTGLRGLTGISSVNGRVIRPLLFSTRREILDYAHGGKIHFREDSSNSSTKYLRNKLRLGLIPRIREINPKFTELMSANIQRLTQTQQFVSQVIEKIRSRVVSASEGTDVIDVAGIDSEYSVDFVVYELMSSAYGFSGEVVDSLCRALRHGSSGKRFYAHGHVAYTDRGRIIVAPIAEDDLCEVEIDERTHKTYCGNSVIFAVHLDIDQLETLNVPHNIALLDASLLKFPLLLRCWKEGDAFIPMGMSGHKKVSDFLIDEKIPLVLKRKQLVVYSGEDLVWVVGQRIDERYRITDITESIVKLIHETC